MEAITDWSGRVAVGYVAGQHCEAGHLTIGGRGTTQTGCKGHFYPSRSGNSKIESEKAKHQVSLATRAVAREANPMWEQSDAPAVETAPR